ncbi:MAG: hypothetical protein LQ338_007313, partial [Usnochroma carphineum]
MDWVQKAKASVDEPQKDASKAMDELNKATSLMGIGDKQAAGSTSSASTPATTTANTPSTSTAPSVAAQSS